MEHHTCPTLHVPYMLCSAHTPLGPALAHQSMHFSNKTPTVSYNYQASGFLAGTAAPSSCLSPLPATSGLSTL